MRSQVTYMTEMGLGKDVDGCAPLILKNIDLVYDKYIGQESVFPLKNGAPRIMMKYKDKPYTYELQPECHSHGLDGENGDCPGHLRKPCCGEMWFAVVYIKAGQSTQICPRAKDDPDHRFRVCTYQQVLEAIRQHYSSGNGCVRNPSSVLS
jgi:hypothetical protein